jgi:cyclic beta-1,2-glucan synthetase
MQLAPQNLDESAFSPLEVFAHQLAVQHTVLRSPERNVTLLNNMQRWSESLKESYRYFRASDSREPVVTRAGEWMLDNFYIVEQTLRQIKEDLPPGYYHQLPKLADTALKGYPRIFALAAELVAYSQCRLDLTQLADFVLSYQQVSPLATGELWALPIMLRIALITHLSTASAAISSIDAPVKPGSDLLLSPVSELSEDTVVANCFISLRLLAAHDWKEFFEDTSRVEQILRTDPAGIYAGMDFETRNSYRRVVEDLAHHSAHDEENIAQMAVGLARGDSGVTNPPPREGRSQVISKDRITHVGFYLIDAGRAQLEAFLGYQPSASARIRRWILVHPIFTYFGSIALFSLPTVVGLLVVLYLVGGSRIQLVVFALLAIMPAMAVAISLVHRYIPRIIPPRTLPRMDFSEAIPDECRTIIVIPTLMTSLKEVDSLLQELELHFLRNPDPNLAFALLSDYADAAAQATPEDAPLLERAATGIDVLNHRYAPRGPFYLFHRERAWNPSEGVWMGWERKRGKLHEFNRVLMGAGSTSYTRQVGDLDQLHGTKYVITLDADTVLPQGSASRLIATLAHPLNRAEFALDGRSVIAGYTVLQPRVGIKPTSANKSLFTRIFAGDTGIDLYTLAVSDVYQDLFGEGSYVGKGIYDVAAFERSLAGQVGENTLLSHDLFEGIYGRTALVTDVSVLEEYPARYLIFTRRLRRWIRGDWQLLPWLLPNPPTALANAPNRLSIIDRWKLFDNLRRSLYAPVLLLLLVLAWLWLPGSPLAWTCLLLLTPVVTILADMFDGLWNIKKRSYSEVLQFARIDLVRWALGIVFLPYEVLLHLDAIGTTLIRLFIVRRRMLQWTTAANMARAFRANARGETWREMSAALVFSAVLGAVVLLNRPEAGSAALPLIAMWVLSPLIAFRISQPIVHKRVSLSEDQHQTLRGLARRTWAFFERYVGPDDHWLPPDHFQEAPRGIIAHQTSPTNIGLLLLSTLAAFDLGYISLLGLAARLQSTFQSMEALERYRGHFLNWYDTRTLESLLPRYVSTVDSGNLAACLLALRQGCDALSNEPLLSAKQWKGLLDILGILTEMLDDLATDQPDLAIEALEADLAEMRARITTIQAKPDLWVSGLSWLSTSGWEKISHRLMVFLEAPPPNLDAETLSGLRLYIERLHHHMMSLQRSIDLLTPWLTALDAPPVLFAQRGGHLAEAWAEFRVLAQVQIPSLAEAAQTGATLRASLTKLLKQVDGSEAILSEVEEARAWCLNLDTSLVSAQLTAQALQIGYQELAREAEAIVEIMDFAFLFDEQRQVFHIGYNAATDKLDANFYDLLASEARIASLIAIIKGDIPHSHWLHLGRPVTKVNGEQVLLSWSGTMFEYLMPVLLIRNYEGTFLSESCDTAVEAQIAYGHEKHVPWGISESGYYAFDANLNYQYQAFGVQQLGFKRNLSDDLVISPYASLIALSVQPEEVLKNLTQLDDLGMLSRYGLYESIDYTETRLPANQTHAIVQSYMAHHQGMILVALDNFLFDNAMVRRFHRDARIQSIELLLQEKVPQDAPIQRPHQGETIETHSTAPVIRLTPWQARAESPLPQVHVLSQGQYSVIITSAGGGYSQWQDLALTRWQADTTLDQDGSWLYIQDRDSGALWSATYQPTAARPDHQEVLFYPHKVEFRRSDRGISLDMQITIGAEGVEIRRMTLLNDTSQPRRLKVTSYGEVVIAAQAADQRHPAFSKLFIESEYLPDLNALLFRRRPRSAHEETPYLLHSLVVERGVEITGDYESDRAHFVGRGRTLRAPAALQSDGSLSGTVGSTLDPMMSLGQEIDLAPHSRVQLAFITLAASTHEQALTLAQRYQSWQMINQTFVEARHHSEVELAELGIQPAALEHIQQLLSALIYSSRALRADPHILASNREGQSSLWRYGISGDYPILLVHSRSLDEPLIVEVLQAFAYWHRQGLKINLVILNQQATGYSSDLRNHLLKQLATMGVAGLLNQRTGIFLLDADQMRDVDRTLLETAARAILDGQNGSLAAQIGRLNESLTRLPDFLPSVSRWEDAEATPPLERPTNLLFDNGLGGFSPDGCEYVIYLEPDQSTPRPWINVIANPEFGFLASEAGSGPSWAANSGENRLTPWSNDPISDRPGEALYLRDEESAQVWSTTRLPAGAAMPSLIRHGAGYSIFEQQSHGLNQEMSVFAVPDAPVKIVRLRLENLWTRQRRITATYYAEWVLGTTRHVTQQYIVPEFEASLHALLASNPYNTEFGERVAFLAASKSPHGLTADREEFLGRLGSLANPAGLGRIGLASVVHAGSDPCAAIQLHVDLAAGQSEEIFFLIGEGSSRDDALALIRQLQDHAAVEAAWQATHTHWDDLLGAVTVTTPDPAMNLMLNRWLLYQTISCRIWGRSALYQSSGAFGFRDQLQDVMAIMHTQPALAREHILRAASHQFEAGDVLHWWHPPSGRGVRTRISDDLLWLPYVTAHYVKITGDTTILDEKVSFLTGDPLKPDEEERYGLFASTVEGYSLYEHCRRSLEKGSTTGKHGLPRMGAGDWNDGMNRVGIEGRGESVWLGWFLYATLMRFTALCEVMKDDPAPYREQAERLAKALEASGWDGEWYRRATYDDGWPLGSSQNKECQIDAIAQSWAVLSGAGNPQRVVAAMAAVNTRLVKDQDGLILLFDPPFDKTARDPGYIKGYPPGIRENGGQYTHASTWTAWAFATLGDGDRAEELFRLLNPIYHADSPEKAERYQVEPYALAADIYSVAPHTGRGGWTWYTGSSGWMYRLGIEAILGLNRVGDTLQINPCIPSHWSSFEMNYRFGEGCYHIVVTNPDGVNRGVQQVMLDGVILPDKDIPLAGRDQPHEVHILMGHL